MMCRQADEAVSLGVKERIWGHEHSIRSPTHCLSEGTIQFLRATDEYRRQCLDALEARGVLNALHQDVGPNRRARENGEATKRRQRLLQHLDPLGIQLQ